MMDPLYFMAVTGALLSVPFFAAAVWAGLKWLDNRQNHRARMRRLLEED